ncbi:MAG: GNAT family N-acetyltransferase [Candidatus Poribacteria bacterium]|nr:GNAT family N-acetyltransferase [Candidatus Poribacteria bacterium]
MKTAPILHTDRLILRSFTLADASDVKRLAGERDVASTTCAIPHPYEDGMAEEWISTHKAAFEKGTGIYLAITLKDNEKLGDTILIGAIDLRIDQTEKIAELGYWVGKPYWNSGYCTEAANAILTYAFDVLELTSIHAFYLKRNPASGRVLEKIGMQFEECFPKGAEKWGKLEDLVKYSIQKINIIQ